MIYFDNAATTTPKPESVLRGMERGFHVYGANPGRSGHDMAIKTAKQVFECREMLADFFHAKDVSNVVFTQNCTQALNESIKGVLRQGDHVIISCLEHNSVLRPVHKLSLEGKITYSIAKVFENDDERTLRSYESLIRSNTKLIIATHGSNVCGLVLPIQKIGELAHSHGILFLVDAAQSAGVLPIDMQRMNIDFLCMPGHKSLYGPSGTGVLITDHGETLDTIMEGGTGSSSTEYTQPEFMPDKLESGTVNVFGIIGLKEGLRYVRQKSLPVIYKHEMQIASYIYTQLSRMPGVLLYTGPLKMGRNLPVIAFNIRGLDSEETTEQLNQMGYALRGGYHCAPLAHEYMGTLEIGAARLSIGAFNTIEQAKRFCMDIKKLLKKNNIH